MSNSFRFHSFYPAVGDWVAVFLEPGNVTSFRAEPIIGWIVQIDQADGAFVIDPVLGGDAVEWTNDYAGVYRRADVETVAVREHLRDLATLFAKRQIGCGAP
jgi:hypothetical protein